MSEYRRRILGLLADRNPITVLSETPKQLEAMTAALLERSEQSYAPGKWTARELLCHLTDAELGIGFRLRQIVAGVETIQPFDQDAWVSQNKKLPLELALNTLLALRAWNLAWLRGLDKSVWERKYHHPERGEETFDVAVRLLAGHDLNHLGQLEQISAQPTP